MADIFNLSLEFLLSFGIFQVLLPYLPERLIDGYKKLLHLSVRRRQFQHPVGLQFAADFLQRTIGPSDCSCHGSASQEKIQRSQAQQTQHEIQQTFHTPFLHTVRTNSIRFPFSCLLKYPLRQR